MSGAQLRDRVKQALVELNLNHGWSADGWLFVVEGDDDRVLYVTFEEAEDSAGETWAAICLATPILEGVSGTLPSDLLVLNHELVAGKVALDGDRLNVEHEIIGWPGNAEFKASLELVLNHRGALAGRLEGVVQGAPPQPYSERAAGAIARAQSN